MSGAELQSGFASFQPRARLLKLIGAELISDDVVAVTELVKNAHDADASSVTILFRNVTQPGGEIVISDDGHGMDRETLLRGWMEPAGSTKLGPDRRFTAKGRRMLGEKGLGRFASDKLGSHLELISRRAGSSAEIRATFDWDQFDSDTQMLGEIQSRWEIRPAAELPRQGTVLRITGLRTVWTERMFRRLSTRLSRLCSPFRDRNDFSIRLESDAFPQYSGELATSFLDRAPYRIDARFDGRDTLVVQVGDSAPARHPWVGPGELTCGPVRIRLYSFDLETDAMARIGPRMEVRAWLKEWSGVSVYRDGFRLWPYGEPHDDWLRLDQRRVNNPVFRLSNNQIVGFVEITQDGNPELKDQTNREGMVHTPALDSLRTLLHHVFHILETERQRLRTRGPLRARAKAKKEQAQDGTESEVLERLAQRAGNEVGGELRRIAGELRERSAREQQQQRRFIEGYADLAAVGQAALGLSTDIETMVENIRGTARRLRMSLQGVSDPSGSLRTLEELAESLDGRLAMLSSAESGIMHRRRTIEVPSEASTYKELVEPLLQQRGVTMEVQAPPNGLLRSEMTPQTLHRVLHILTANSLDWFHGVSRPKITIKVRPQGEDCVILFGDNGPGISSRDAEAVFEPMFTLKDGGRGMGLTIARNILELHGGSIEVIIDGRLRGANLRLLLPRKRPKRAVP